ncbi:MAG: alpha/beta hydrolase [Paracoccaceae bacterium]
MAHGLGPEVFARQSHALQVRPDQQTTLRRIRVRTLILCGEYENATPRLHNQMMSQLLPDASLRVIKGAGDFSNLEHPLATSNALKKWLTSYDDLPIVGGHLFETQIA